MIYILGSEDIRGQSIGNKAKFLSKLKEEGFNIPDGFVLDVDIYKSFVKFHKIDKEIDKFIKELNIDSSEEISRKIIGLFENKKLQIEVREELEKLIKDSRLYAVRSSGTKEDLDNHSFAGQYESYLNINGIENIEESINKCYQSMFSSRILNYFLKNNISFENLQMPVIIQEMVNPSHSGICFTVHPTKGYDKKMLIEIAEGLGEDIVNGRNIPEEYIYNWYDNVVEAKGNKNFLTVEQCREFGKVFLDIQLYFGYPCDIEFSIEDNRLYILQARKITKLQYGAYKDIWTTADFKDGGVSASVCKPFMWSLYEYVWEYSLRKFILDSKILKEEDVDKKLGNMFFGRGYWNMSVVKHAMSKIIGYKERNFDNEFGVTVNYEGDGQVTNISLSSIFHILKIYLAQRKIMKYRRNNIDYLKEELLESYEKYKRNYKKDKIEDIKSIWYKLTKEDYLYSETNYFWQIFINTIYQSIYKDSLLKHIDEKKYLGLLSNIDNISHLLPFYDMWDISREIRKDKESLEFWEKNEANTIIDNLSKDNYSLNKVREFISEYGYHSDKELDVSYPCYYEDPLPLIQSIKDMIKQEDSFSSLENREDGIKEYEEILDRISSKTSSRKFNNIKGKIEEIRSMLWWREEFRDLSTRLYYIIRVYTMELAKELRGEGVLNKEEDIWFLKLQDLWNYLDGKISVELLNENIRKNSIYYNGYRNYISDNEIGIDFKQVKEERASDNTIKGVGANSGVVTGKARVIYSFEEIDEIEENDILVTKFTDTGWTRKFGILSGIVTEYGGILSHVAIVSREYNIPSIVSCPGVLEKINTGDIITLDGSNGIITIEKRV